MHEKSGAQNRVEQQHTSPESAVDARPTQKCPKTPRPATLSRPTSVKVTVTNITVDNGAAAAQTPTSAIQTNDTASSISVTTSTSNTIATTTTTTSSSTASVTTTVGKSSAKELGPTAPSSNYCNRRTWVTTDRLNELRRRAQEAVKHNKTFTIRGCFHSVRNALVTRGWVEKLDVHRKQIPSGVCQVTYDDLAQGLPKRKPGETRRQYIAKCERNIMSRFLEHMPIDFLWTNRKEKCDYIDQAKNPGMIINKFHRAPFTSKEGLCAQLKDFHWFYEEGTSELYFPRCYNVWSLEELAEFVDNFKLTACIAFVRLMVDRYRQKGIDGVFSVVGTVPYATVDFVYKRCSEYLDGCQHKDIDVDELSRVWEHEWDAFLHQHQQLANEGAKIYAEVNRTPEFTIKTAINLLENMQNHWPQYSLDGYQNLWIVKPANKCRGRGIQLMDNLKKILVLVNPSIGSKSRYVVQKYIERPLTIHRTKFDIRQWFLITNVQPLVVWMYKESYLRFSSQEYSLSNHHESVHLTNHAIQKKYNNGKRDKRLPNENMWDCYSFQAYLRQIGKQDMWLERIYPGMKRAIVGTMLSSQENMDRRPNTFELFGADFMICEDFYPWLIEINSSPDLGATTSVTARMCPQSLEDVIKVVIDRRIDPKSDMGNFELIYRQLVPPTPAYMGLNLFVKGKQLVTKLPQHFHHHQHSHREKGSAVPHNGHYYRQRPTIQPAISNVHKAMPTFNATEYVEKYIMEATMTHNNSQRGSISGQSPPNQLMNSARRRFNAANGSTTICPNLLKTPRTQIGQRRKSCTNLAKATVQLAKEQDAGSTAAACLKRHRSCGARLNTGAGVGVGVGTQGRSTLNGKSDHGRSSNGGSNLDNTTDNLDQHFKFIIKRCGLPQPVEPLTTEPATVQPVATNTTKSKSADNIIEILHKAYESARPLVQSTNPSAKHSHQPSFSRSRSVLNEKSLAADVVSHVNQQSPQKSCKAGSKTPPKPLPIASEAARLEVKRTNSASIRTVGRSLVTWRASRRHLYRMTAATAARSGVSVYVCKKMPAATESSSLTRQPPLAAVSPTRQRSSCNNNSHRQHQHQHHVQHTNNISNSTFNPLQSTHSTASGAADNVIAIATAPPRP